MKVLSLDSKKQYVLVSEDFKLKKMKSAKDFIVKNNRLSTRGIGGLSSTADIIGDKIYWLNPTIITIDYTPDNGEYFFFVVNGENTILEMDGRQLVIDERIWDGADPLPIECDLYYHYSNGGNELINPNILIIPLPSEIQLRKKR